ncbi:diguanylate cyclase domain-containing protein [Mycolicibacterium arseniciresistens]|uniref:Diguanylate cyclase n=1 Tax=Mycolicibacterium arseniciresistens TaxID=3062257 RepID=A0ABT8UL76_9MYCO|nr:diguanylate cyclase [Mycolicibacterium arseniciresistens]MDO3637123.1 diguanylate cyclase [Mycolicibacterium arseniciresistens]
MRPRRPHEEDRYYWLTAYFASRDLQVVMCRAIAATIVGLGLVPAVLLASPAGPQGPLNRGVAVGIAVCCLVMGWVWRRPRWPTRRQSQTTVVIGSGCIALACLIQHEPVVGMLGATGLATLSAFTMLFHSGRLLAVPWTVGGAVLAVLAARIAVDDIARAVFAVGLVLLVIVMFTVACRTAIRLIGIEPCHTGIEPLTGLLTRETFDERMATLLGARSRGDDRYLVVLVVSLDSFSLLTGLHGPATGDRARVAIAQRLRENVRRDTVLAHVADTDYLIADLFTRADPEPLTERIHATVRNAPFRLTASIGAVSTSLMPLSDQPVPDVVDELLDVATAAMAAARRDGGSRTALRLSPRLRVLDRLDDEWH